MRTLQTMQTQLSSQTQVLHESLGKHRMKRALLVTEMARLETLMGKERREEWITANNKVQEYHQLHAAGMIELEALRQQAKQIEPVSTITCDRISSQDNHKPIRIKLLTLCFYLSMIPSIKGNDLDTLERSWLHGTHKSQEMNRFYGSDHPAASQ
jgi:TFIIF-interacting CTD phosphatase-like protein